MKSKFDFDNCLIAMTMAISLFILNACQEKNVSTRTAPQNIPIERREINGTYSSSALAQRVDRALREDVVLQAIFELYVLLQVSQKGSKIILKGTVSSEIYLNRVIDVTQNVRGVTEIDYSQVKIQKELLK